MSILHGTGKVDEAKLEKILPQLMNLKPRGIREHLDLNKPIYRPHLRLRPFRPRAGCRWRVLLGEDRPRGRDQARCLTERRPSAAAAQLYGRRKGPKLSAQQADLRETLLPQAGAAACGRMPIRARIFRTPVDEVWLEVGFGAGEHLVWQAQHHPDVGLIGAEPYEMGVAKLLTRMLEGRRRTSRLYEGDGREIIEALPDASLGRVFLLFPDPWPKTRHHKRRFLQMEMLDALARVMKPGAELRFATDDKGYLALRLERLMAHPGFDWLPRAPQTGKSRPPTGPRPATKPRRSRVRRPFFGSVRRAKL